MRNVKWSTGGQAMTAYIHYEDRLAQADMTRMQVHEVEQYFVDQRDIYRLVRAAPVFLLNRLIVPPILRRMGLGTQLVEATVLEADKLKHNLIVEARAYPKTLVMPGLNQADLVQFYLRHGFLPLVIYSTFSYLYYVNNTRKQTT